MTSNSEAPAAPARTQDYLYMVFDNPVEGQDAEFNRWYDEEHVKDMAAVPGFFSGRRYVLAEDQIAGVGPAKPKYMVIYHFRTDAPADIKAEIARREASGEIKFSPALDTSSVEGYNFNMLAKSFNGTSGMSAMEAGEAPDYCEVMLDSAVSEDESLALNAWYDDHHMDELMAIPGFINAYRAVWADVQLEPAKHTSDYFAFVALRTADVPGFAASIKTDTPEPAALDKAKAYRYTYRALAPYVLSGVVRKEREIA